MAKKQIINDLWQAYVTTVYNKLPDPEGSQYIQVRRAFYAGVYAFMGLEFSSQLTPGPEAEQADIELMESIDEELKAFLAGELKRGPK